jgi:hypothetical protein
LFIPKEDYMKWTLIVLVFTMEDPAMPEVIQVENFTNEQSCLNAGIDMGKALDRDDLRLTLSQCLFLGRPGE